MRVSLPAAIAGLALLVPIAGVAQVSKGVAAAPGISFQPAPAAARPAPAPARDSSSGRHAGHGSAAGGDQFLATERTYAPRYDPRFQARHHRRLPYLRERHYFLAGAEPFPATGYAPELPIAADETDAGILRLLVAPPSARVFIDGFSFGAPESGTSQYLLEAGVHRVELQAEGFERAAFDVRIKAGDTLTLSQQLTDLSRTDTRLGPAVAVAARAVPKTLYVIPRCYAGDRQPDLSQLPAGCDPATLRIIPAGR